MPTSPKTIDEYLARVPEDKRGALEKLRTQIKAAAPRAEECISYQMPAFRLDGRMLVWFGAASKHCSFFPGASPIATYEQDLSAYSTSKGTVRFTPDKPLPASLVKKLVKVRVEENAARRQAGQAGRGTTGSRRGAKAGR